MTGIRLFINYRRADAAAYARDIYGALSDHFGADSVFMDIDKIELGSDFSEALDGALDDCHILIAVIGRDWLSAADGHGQRRIDQPDDYVRLELEAALHRNIRIIPVLVQDASMPSSAQLPDSLASLGRRQAFELTDRRWNLDMGILVEELDKLVARLGHAPADPPVVDQPKKPEHEREPGRRRAIVAGVAVAVVIAVIAIVVALVANGSNSPTAGKVVTTTTVAKPKPASAADASVDDGLFHPTGREQSLLAYLRRDAVSNCSRDTTKVDPKPTAAVYCGVNGPANGTVTIRQFANRADLDKSYANEVQYSGGVADRGSCTAPVPKNGHGEGPISTGRMVCYADTNPTTTNLVWTNDANNLLFDVYSQEDGPPLQTLQHTVDFYNDDIIN